MLSSSSTNDDDDPNLLLLRHRRLRCYSLGLDDPNHDNQKNNNDNDNNTTEKDPMMMQPRRFLSLPSGELLAYGGDNGNVSCLLPNHHNHNKQTTKKKQEKEEEEEEFVIVQRYDDEVRAMAVSSDGKRIAIGFDSGETILFPCGDDDDDYNNTIHENQNERKEVSLLLFHPFVQRALERKIMKQQQKKNENDTNDDDDDDALLFMSQDFDDLAKDSDYFAGPVFGTPIRDLLFLPPTSSSMDEKKEDQTQYRLVIASEEGMCIVNATNAKQMMSTPRLLDRQVQEQHDHGGIRGITISDDGTILASLSMDGRICLWDMKEMKLLLREHVLCIPKKDVGEIHGADAFDRSCRPILSGRLGKKDNDSSLILGTPGKLSPYLRQVNLNNHNNNNNIVDVQYFDESCFVEETTVEKSHLDSIVCMLLCGTNVLVTTGRDSRLVIWKCCDNNKNNNNSNNSNKEDDDMMMIHNQPWKALETYHLVSPATDLCLRKQKKQHDDNNKNTTSTTTTTQWWLYVACANGRGHTIDMTQWLKKETTNSNENIISSLSKKSIVQGTLTEKDPFEEEEDDDDDDVDYGSIDTSKVTKGVRFVDHEADEDNNDSSINNGASLKGDDSSDVAQDQIREEGEEANDDFALDDVVEDRRRRPPNDMISEHQYHHDSFSSRRMKNVVEPQEPFSPSESIPNPNDELRRFRYLCWNHIGTVTIQGDEDDDVYTIEIRFPNALEKRKISFEDDVGMTLGSIGEDGAIFASGLQEISEEDDDDDDKTAIDELDGFQMSERTMEALRRDRKKNRKPSNKDSEPKGSQVLFWKFHSVDQGSNNTWLLNLPDGEEAVGVACGSQWSAVMTSRRFLRFFTSGGVQAEIVWLKGEPVAMVGRDQFLAAFYHESNPLDDGTQKLGFTLWDAQAFRVIAQGSVSCLSKGAKLIWVGFSNELSLFAMDSDGMLSMLVATGDYSGPGAPMWDWVPILDTMGLRKSKDDSYWPVSIVKGKLVFVPLKGGRKYPPANIIPVTTAIALRMPMSRSGFRNHLDLEEASIRANLALSQKKIINELNGEVYGETDEYRALCTAVDKVTLKLIYNKICDGQADAALGLVDRLHLEETCDVAIKMADRYRMNKLAALMERTKDQRFGSGSHFSGFGDDEDGYDNDLPFDNGNDSQPSRSNSKSVVKRISPEQNKRSTLRNEDLVNPKKARHD